MRVDGVGPLVLDAGDHPAVLRRLPGHLPAKVAAEEPLAVLVPGLQEETRVKNRVGAASTEVEVDSTHVLAQHRQTVAARTVVEHALR